MKKRCTGSLWNVMIRLCLIVNLEVIKIIEFENPLEDQYDEFFKRYFDCSNLLPNLRLKKYMGIFYLTDKMMEFREK